MDRACKTSAACVFFTIRRTYWFSFTQNCSCLISLKTAAKPRVWILLPLIDQHAATYLWLPPLDTITHRTGHLSYEIEIYTIYWNRCNSKHKKGFSHTVQCKKKDCKNLPWIQLLILSFRLLIPENRSLVSMCVIDKSSVVSGGGLLWSGQVVGFDCIRLMTRSKTPGKRKRQRVGFLPPASG